MAVKRQILRLPNIFARAPTIILKFFKGKIIFKPLRWRLVLVETMYAIESILWEILSLNRLIFFYGYTLQFNFKISYWNENLKKLFSKDEF